MSHGLPDWSNDERILALDLYLREGMLDDEDPRVVALSNALRALPVHEPRPEDPRFRNPNGVALKIANFAALDPDYPGVAMSRGSRGDQELWNLYGHDTEAVARLAAAIRDGGVVGEVLQSEEDEEEVAEGAILYRRHRTRERNSSLVKRKKRTTLERLGALVCEVCRFDFERFYGDLGHGFIECHHVVPLSELGSRRTRLSDLALLCSNCHRMAHRRKPWPSLDELKASLAR